MDLASAYRDGRERLTALVSALHDDAEVTVPLTPAWRVRDVVAHVVGVAEDLLASTFPDFSDPKGRPEQAVAREEWTAAQVARRRDWPLHQLLDHWSTIGAAVEHALEADADDARYPAAARIGAPFDLACHLHDVRHALGRPGDRDAVVTHVGFAISRSWLEVRLQRVGLGPLTLRTPDRSWVLGDGEPVATVTGQHFELFRALSGRRSRTQILQLDWTGEPDPFLDVLSPYPLPDWLVRE